MTKLATMGTSSCATMALQGFREEDIQLNRKWMSGELDFAEPNFSVRRFYDDVLYPITQDLGRTDDYPFDLLMKRINNHIKMGKKFLIATLDPYQVFIAGGSYWLPRLEHWGFEHIHTTKNSIGDKDNYIFVRDPNKQEFVSLTNKATEQG